jgi:hypothetical protein
MVGRHGEEAPMSGPNHRRGTTNRNDRGSAAGRRARKQWLLDTFGDGVTAPCQSPVHHEDCPGELVLATLSVDRITAKLDGGTYARDNIRPAFGLCNSLHGGLLRAERAGQVIHRVIDPGSARVQP